MLLDVPNDRSSHTIPTPRGGGVAIVTATIAAAVALFAVQIIQVDVLLPITIGGLLVAFIGALDDRQSVPARWRLLVHFTAALIVVLLLRLPWPFVVIACFYVVWLLNLTNFMDGIDGIAGVETITVCMAMAALTQLEQRAAAPWILPAILAAATLGFLVWNWPPAKIFMGDAGSGFIGFTLGLLSLHAATVDMRLFWCWVVMLGVFVTDATLTLFVRVANREPFYEAHRSHAYQHMARAGGSHLRVTVGVGLINLVWLLPIAVLIADGRISGPMGIAIAYSPLLLAAVKMRAGRHT